MSVAELLYLVLGFSVGLSVAAAFGAKFFLRASDDAPDRAKNSDSDSRVHAHNGDGEALTVSKQVRTNIESLLSNATTTSPAPDDMRNQLDFAARLWPDIMRYMFSEEWRNATELSKAFEHQLQETQDQLDLHMPHTDYTQFVRSRALENLDWVFRVTGRYSRSA